MLCDKCNKGKIVLHAFSQGECLICKTNITTPHIPCDLLCQTCSDEHMMCKECGTSEIKKK